MRISFMQAVVSSLLAAGRCMAADHVVHLNDMFPPNHMTPNSLTIAVGDTVTFISDHNSELHNVHALDGSFLCSSGCVGDGSGAIGDPMTNWKATVKFTRPGLVKYGCDEHPSTMSVNAAVIDVVGPPQNFDLNQAGLSGAWANPAADSQGFLFDVVPNFGGNSSAMLFGGWFTYDTRVSGGVRWYTIQGQLGPADRSTIPIYQTFGGRFDSAQATQTRAAGTATIGFIDCTHASLSYVFDDGRSGSFPLVRLLANTTCADGPAGSAGRSAENSAWSGAWADFRNSGQGLVFEFNPIQSALFAAWYTFDPAGAAGGGASSQEWYTLQAPAPRGANALHDIAISHFSGGLFDQRPLHGGSIAAQVGTADLTLRSCTSATLAYRFAGGKNSGLAGTLDLARVTPAPAGCRLWP